MSIIKKMNRLLPYIYISILLSFSSVAFAQGVVETSLDTNAIKIGEQTKLHYSVEIPHGTDYAFPLYQDSIIENVEVVEQSDADTVAQTEKTLTVKQSYLITSFESGGYYLGNAPVVLGTNDTVFSESVFLGVGGVDVDTTQAINDIYMPYDAPFSLLEIWFELLIALVAILILGGLALWYFLVFKKKEPELQNFTVKKKIEPHIEALRKLQVLKEKALWKEQKHKDNQSLLSQVVREYIELRFSILALEMTSDEIIDDLKTKDVKSEQILMLQQLFSLADLTKFAKHIPLDVEHEKGIDNAISFVKETAIVVEADDTAPKSENE